MTGSLRRADDTTEVGDALGVGGDYGCPAHGFPQRKTATTPDESPLSVASATLVVPDAEEGT